MTIVGCSEKRQSGTFRALPCSSAFSLPKLSGRVPELPQMLPRTACPSLVNKTPRYLHFLVWRTTPPPPGVSNQLLAENHGLRFRGPRLHPSCFTLICDSFQWVLKVIDWRGQRGHIICKKQRPSPEAPKSDKLFALAAPWNPVPANKGRRSWMKHWICDFHSSDLTEDIADIPLWWTKLVKSNIQQQDTSNRHFICQSWCMFSCWHSWRAVCAWWKSLQRYHSSV